jgi:hypothetical protein
MKFPTRKSTPSTSRAWTKAVRKAAKARGRRDGKRAAREGVEG